MAKRGPQEKYDNETLFLYYYNFGERRTYIKVSEDQRVPYNTIREMADRHDWDGRAAHIDEESRQQQNKRLASIISKQRAADIDTLRVLTGKFRRRLADTITTADGSVVINPAMLHDADISLTEYIAAVKAFELLTGGATERVGAEDGDRLDLAAIDAEIAELDRRALEDGNNDTV